MRVGATHREATKPSEARAESSRGLEERGVRKMPFNAASGLLATRWKKDGETGYFVVNTGVVARTVSLAADFTIADPMSGRIWKSKCAALEPAQSLFVVGDGFEIAARCEGAPAKSNRMAVVGPWELSPVCGGPTMPVTRTIKALDGWETLDEFFSGTMLYKATFDLPQGICGDGVELSLGDVREIARVRLNGRDLGVRFMAPYCLDLPQ